jgi:type I restriction enzyme S subunit
MKDGWTYKTFGEVFDLQMGRTPDRKNPSLFGGDNIWVSIRDIDRKYIDGSKEHITNEAVVKSGIKLVKKGTVIMSFKLTVGKCAIARKDLYTNEAIMAFNVNDGFILDSSFLYYYLQGYQWSGTNKAVMGLTLNKTTISKQKIAIPPLAEQERIVAELDLLSSIIDKKKAQLKELDQLAQSIFYNMFGGILEDTPSYFLKDIASYYIGLTYKPTDVSEEGTIVLRSSNIQNNKLDFNDVVRVNVNINDNKIVHDGDILMCARNGSARLVGKVARIKDISEKMSFGAFMTIIRSDYNDYLFHFFLSDYFRSQLTTSKTATINQITSRMLDNIKTSIPPLPIQQEFASKIEAIERQKSLIQQSIVETQTLFDSRMDHWFG